MPIYEYQCSQCNQYFEFLEGLGRGENTPICPNCQSRKAERILSRFSFFDSSNSWSKGSKGEGDVAAKTSGGGDAPKTSSGDAAPKTSGGGGASKTSGGDAAAKTSKS